MARPSADLRRARADLRAALERYTASLLKETGLAPTDPAARDVVANLRASDDAATRAATVAGIVEAP